MDSWGFVAAGYALIGAVLSLYVAQLRRRARRLGRRVTRVHGGEA